MKASLQPGLTHSYTYTVLPDKTVPHLYTEAEELQVMPEVFATGFLVGLIELTCIKLLKSHLDWPREQSVGTGLDISHKAATPPGFSVTVEVELIEVDRKRLVFAVSARDDQDIVSRGTHERFVIDKEKFAARVAQKADSTR